MLEINKESDKMIDWWKDITTYSKSDKGKIPKVWENRIHGLRIVVHRHIWYEKDDWLLSCNELGIDNWKLNNKDRNKALKEAIEMITGKLESKIKEYKYILELLD